MNYKIEELILAGIRHPRIYFSCWIHSVDPQVELIIDDRTIGCYSGSIDREDIALKFDEKKPNRYGISETILLGKSPKKIELVLKDGEKELTRETIYNQPKTRIRGTLHFIREEKKWRKVFVLGKIIMKKTGLFGFISGASPDNKRAYASWISKYEPAPTSAPENQKIKFSILIPVYNPNLDYFKACIDSCLAQTYGNFELCLADDCSGVETKNFLKSLAKTDPRIKITYRKKNGGISEATNSALDIATGDYVCLLDNDDTIAESALAEFADVIMGNKKAKFLYSDEDKLDKDGRRCYPHFKPDWSPDTMLGFNYITHFVAIKRDLFDITGGFRKEYDGAQDYDLFLRITDILKRDEIIHIPKILYHWRISDTSTAASTGAKSYVIEAGRNAIIDSMKRKNIDSAHTSVLFQTRYIVDYDMPPKSFTSIIIPTRNHADVLKRCIDSIYRYTDQTLFEIIIVDNGSDEPDTLAYFDKIKSEHQNLQVLRLDIPFNYSTLNNEAVKIARGNFLLFLNNDTEVLSTDWLEKLVGYASRPHIGAVGAKLLYPNNTVQHAGVIIGLGGIAGHAFLNLGKSDEGYVSRAIVPVNVGAVTGACLAIEKKKFNKIGGFDETQAVAFNDIDLCLKLLQAGYYNLLAPQIILKHHESLSRGAEDTPEKQMRFKKEVENMKRKWGTATFIRDPFYNDNLSLTHDYCLRSDHDKKYF